MNKNINTLTLKGMIVGPCDLLYEHGHNSAETLYLRGAEPIG